MRNFFAATNLIYHNIYHIDTRKLETKSLDFKKILMIEFGELAHGLIDSFDLISFKSIREDSGSSIFYSLW